MKDRSEFLHDPSPAAAKVAEAWARCERCSADVLRAEAAVKVAEADLVAHRADLIEVTVQLQTDTTEESARRLKALRRTMRDALEPAHRAATERLVAARERETALYAAAESLHEATYPPVESRGAH